MVGIALIIFLLIGSACSSENSEFCQRMVIKDCAPHLNGFLEVKEQGTWDRSLTEKCQRLQQSITCLSVPRCTGDLLASFRSIVLVTATLIKSNKLCPGLEYAKLQDYVKGEATSCNGTKVVYDECQRKCRCYDGELIFCHRVRKEFTASSFEERRRFVHVLKTAATNPIYRDEYTRLRKLHSRMPSQLLHHMPQIFLPWHRWFLLQFENFLRQIDCRVTVPFWDWSRDSGQWARGTERRDVWSPGPYGLGGNGVLPDGCVEDGPFKEGAFFVPETIGNDCLKRRFNLSCSLPNKEQTEEAANQENFAQFERTVREQFHPALHDCVGGHMLKHSSASFTPEFWIHHSFIDKLWADWQMKGDSYKFQYFTNVDFEMPATGHFPWEFLDNQNLPGDVKITYSHPEDSVEESMLENFV